LHLSKLGLLPCESLRIIYCLSKGNRQMLIRTWFCIPFMLLWATDTFAQTMVPEFTANRLSGCAPLTVQFTDQTTGDPLFWNWDFGNGTLSTVKNPVVTFSQPGTYSVTLVVRNADGTTGITKTDYITVNPSPRAAFSANITTGCVPVTVQFRDESTAGGGSIASWLWTFDDGTTSTEQNPQKTYDKEGFYNVSLTVTSNSGCRSSVSKNRYIRIVGGVKPEFSFNASASCRPPYPVTFNNLTSGPGDMTFQWTLGNGETSTTFSPSTTYQANGSYDVTLTATSEFGCQGSITKPVVLNGPETVIDVPDTVCQNQKVFVRNGSSEVPQSVQWDFGNGEQSPHLNDSALYTVPGDYTVKLYNTYSGCVDSAIKNIHVRPGPNIDFSAGNAISCQAPLTVTFTDASSSPIVDWQWNFGDGSTGTGSPVNHTYNSAGDYNVSAVFTDNKGCQASISKPAIVKIELPKVSIKNAPVGGCVPFTWNPDDSVYSLDGVRSWHWDFGDGTTSTQQAPSHTYTSPGTYNVTLTITTNGGCTESITVPRAVQVGTPPSPDFTMSATDICASETVQFTDQSTPASGISSWRWDFGDGTTSSEQNPTHQFIDTGTFAVRLTVENNGCPETSERQFIRVRPPVAGFIPHVECGGLEVQFENTSIIDNSEPVTYSWDFGDGTTSTEAAPTHTYGSFDAYTVTLTVTNGSCSDVFVGRVNLVRETANFTISDDPGCRNAPITFTSTNNPDNIASFEWQFDGGAFGTSNRDTVVRFNTNGRHTITLRITDRNGCVDTQTGTIDITSPTADITANGPGGCENTMITFTDQSTPDGSPITNWTFDFGDGQTQSFTGGPLTHLYTDTGRYVVKMTVRDARGCTGSVTLNDPIFIGRPRAWFYARRDTICPTSPVAFTDSSQGERLTYQWNFGDGQTSTQRNPTHTYGGSDSTYTVQLIVRDRGGCTDTATRPNYITTIKPKPAFEIRDTTTICPPIETKFTFRGTDYDSLYWDFGDSSTSSLMNPTHFYNDYGSYEAKLYIVGYGGCIDSASSTVNLYNPRAATTWNYNPTNACNELLVNFDITTPPSTSFRFFFGDGTSDTSQATSFQHFYRSPAFYNPSLVLYDKQGCEIGVGGPTTIRVIGAEPLFGVNQKRFCDSGTVAFTNYTIGNDPVVSRTWDFGDGSPTTSEYHPVHFYSQPGTFIASQTVTTQTGCTKTITDTIRVYATPRPSISGDSIACINDVFRFEGLLAYPDSTVTWDWQIGSTRFNTKDITLMFPVAGDYTLSVKATNALGCADSATKQLHVPPVPDINIETNPTIPVSSGITLPVTYGQDVATYRWSPDRNLSCLDCPNPYANPKQTTTYRVRVEDIHGCPNTKEITVNVVCSGLNYFIPNTFSPNNDGVNDVFAPRGVGLTRINSMKIFNRWGELVFEKMNFLANDRTPNGGWDGTYKGKPASPDVYIYIIEFVCENSQIVPVKGNVALIR
jgi:FOG: PKD repeat